MEEIKMKTWNKPEVAELNISKTANGYFDVNWEGPLDIVFGDKSNNNTNKPSTPNDNPEEMHS